MATTAPPASPPGRPTGLFRAGPRCNVGGVMCLDDGDAGSGFTNETQTLTSVYVSTGVVLHPVYSAHWGPFGGYRRGDGGHGGFLGRFPVRSPVAYVPVPWLHLDRRTTRLTADGGPQVADGRMSSQPSGATLADTVRGWWHKRLHGKYVQMRADCERIHGPGGCDGTSVKELTDVFGQATATIGAASIGGSVQRVAGGIPRALGTKATEVRVVIGRVKDLRNLPSNERALLGRLPNQGSPRANWKQNAGVLRQEMRRGRPIRDASPKDDQGTFLNAERALLRHHGWMFDQRTSLWIPPTR